MRNAECGLRNEKFGMTTSWFRVLCISTLNSELRTEFSNPGLENYEGQFELD